MTRHRVVVAGLGDAGVLTAGALARHVDVVAVTTTPGWTSGQELGMRLARPEAWARDYRIDFDRFRALDRVDVVHGQVSGLDAGARTVAVEAADGATRDVAYDALVVATGVSNGFWRPGTVLAKGPDLAGPHERIAASSSVAVVGGGAAAVGAAANLAARWPGLRVDLYFPGERALPHHHRRVWAHVAARLERHGVGLHPGHRAVLPGAERLADLDTGPVTFSTAQPPAAADLVLWAVGRVRPNTGWLPPEVLDEHGFVRVDPRLRVLGADGEPLPRVLSVGDVAATDPLRTSARNNGHRVAAHNVRALLSGRPLRSYRPPRRRWGSVLGPQRDGTVIYAPGGGAYRIPAPLFRGVVMPLIVKRGTYGGIRREPPSDLRA